MQILKWRFVFNADITKMCRQILVHTSNTPFQRILLRNPNGEVCDQDFNTVTRSKLCSILGYSGSLLVFPGYKQAKMSHYINVDDVLAGVHSIKRVTGSTKALGKVLGFTTASRVISNTPPPAPSQQLQRVLLD